VVIGGAGIGLPHSVWRGLLVRDGFVRPETWGAESGALAELSARHAQAREAPRHTRRAVNRPLRRVGWGSVFSPYTAYPLGIWERWRDEAGRKECARKRGSDQGIGQGHRDSIGGRGRQLWRSTIARIARGAEQTRDAIVKLGRQLRDHPGGCGKPPGGATVVGRCDRGAGVAGYSGQQTPAIEKRAPFVEITEQDYMAVIEVDLTAPFFLTQCFAKHRIAQKKARQG